MLEKYSRNIAVWTLKYHRRRLLTKVPDRFDLALSQRLDQVDQALEIMKGGKE